MLPFNPHMALAVPSVDENCFTLESGCLHCAGVWSGGQWIIAFTVYLERSRDNGAKLVRRMVPTILLRDRLRQEGLHVEFDGHPFYPSLVGQSALGPIGLPQQMARVVSGDCSLLYTDPEPGEWGDFL